MDRRLAHAFLAIVFVSQLGAAALAQDQRNTQRLTIGEMLPTGQRITPTAAPGAQFRPLIPNPGTPGFTAGQAVELAVSPDGSKMLALTSGYNRTLGPDGRYVPELSTEHVFIYDISGRVPVRRQAIRLANAFNGLAWRADGAGFLISNGVGDAIRAIKWDGSRFVFDGPPIPLGHKAGNGIEVRPMAAGIAVSPRGDRLLVANFANDSVSLVDLASRKVVAEQDLRPGKIDAAMAGVAGGEYPFAVAWVSDSRAYVGSQRDREILLLAVTPDGLSVKKRIRLAGQPTKMILNKDRSRLFVAVDNSDPVVAMEARDGDILAEYRPRPRRGAGQSGQAHGPNNLALSPDGPPFRDQWQAQRRRSHALRRDVLADDDDPPQSAERQGRR